MRLVIFQGRLVHAPGSEEAGNLVEYASCLLLIDLHRCYGLSAASLGTYRESATAASLPATFPRAFPHDFAVVGTTQAGTAAQAEPKSASLLPIDGPDR